jgi:hypothetical protein
MYTTVQAGPRTTPTRRRRDTLTGTQIESVPEARMHRKKARGRPSLSRAICSSSSETDQHAHVYTPLRSLPLAGQGLPLCPSPLVVELSTAASIPASSPLWAVRRPENLEGPTYICPRKKQKADSTLPRSTKRPAISASNKPDFSDADDEDEARPRDLEVEETGGALAARDDARDDAPVDPPLAAASQPPACPPLATTASTIPAEASCPALSVPVVPSSQDSSSQSGSDSQNPAAESEKTAKAALHNLETATGIHVPQKYRSAMVEHSLALGKRQTLETFRQACRYW